jgi:hypothetical protein
MMKQVYEDVVKALQPLEEIGGPDNGPSEYVALMLMVIDLCAKRIAQRTGAEEHFYE